MKKHAVLSLSGGMDSTCLLIHLLALDYHVTCVSFNYGQKHSVELERAQENIKYLSQQGYDKRLVHHIVDLSSVMGLFNSSLTDKNKEVPQGHYAAENMKSTVVPNRNAIFSSIIFGLALSEATKSTQPVEISLGIHAGDHDIYPDCRPEFRDAIEHAFKIGNWDSQLVNYYTPYLSFNKTLILEDCLENCNTLGLDFDMILSNTITSYDPDEQGRSSGKSGSDIERIEAFINIGRVDPIEYVDNWEVVKEHARSLLKK